MNKKYLDVFSLAKMQRNAKFKTPYLNILASQKTPQGDVSTKILYYKDISYFNTTPQFLIYQDASTFFYFQRYC